MIYTAFDHDCCSHLELSSRYAKLGQMANILRHRAYEMDQQEIRYQQQAVQLAKSGTQRLIEDNRLLRKQKLDLEREVTRLKMRHQHCLCRCGDTIPRNKS